MNKHDDFSCDPRKWSAKKLFLEAKNGMPAVIKEYRRRLNECDVGYYRGIEA